MKLILYEKFWDAMIKLPKQIQKKIPGFIEKFREDSRSAAIHLEPISTFRDQSLRTARIDQKYRAIIRVPEGGDTYYLLWIDNHDEAMDWAMNKVFSWNDLTQSFQVYSEMESSDGPGHDMQPPTAESALSPDLNTLGEKYSDDDLLAIGVPEPRLDLVKGIGSLDDLGRYEDILPFDAFENLFYLLDGMDIRDIIRDVLEGVTTSSDPEEKEKSLNNQRSFYILEDDALLDRIFSGDLEKWRIFLHPSQRIIVDGDYKGSMKVTGAAGTGKTVAAIHRLKVLVERSGDSGQPVLFCTYTKALTENLRHQIEGLGVDRRFYEVVHIDGLIRELAQKEGLEQGSLRILNFPGVRTSTDLWEEVLEQELSRFEPEFLDDEYRQVILLQNVTSESEYYSVSRIGRQRRISRKDKMEIWRLIRVYQDLQKKHSLIEREALFNQMEAHFSGLERKPYGHVIVDELQDFSAIELRFIRSLVAEKENDLFLVGDPMQSIYSRNLNFSKCGIHIRGRRSKRLKINYRTTEEIRRAAVSMISGLQYDDFEGEAESRNGYLSIVHGSRPHYTVFSTVQEQFDRIRSLIEEHLERGLQYSDICISCRLKDGVKEIKRDLHLHSVPYLDISGSGKVWDGKGVILSTMHNMKGLEFKVVILAGIQNTTFPFRPSAYASWSASHQLEYMKNERSLMYVAMSRAMTDLYVFGVGRKSEDVHI